MNTSTPELEIALHKENTGTVAVELRFLDPSSDAEITPRRGPATVEAGALCDLVTDPEAYGRRLTEGLFADPDVRALYDRAVATTQATERKLRLRLLVGPSAPELQALCWELLRDPETGAPLATSENILFSRFLPSSDWRPVRLRAKAQLRALVAVAAPSNLAQYGLAEVDAAGEVRRASGALEGLEVRVIGRDEALTLDLLARELRGGVDLLYLVCHGAIHKTSGDAALFLQNDDGTLRRTPAEELARRVAELDQAPRLAVLASCESAGAEGEAPVAVPSALAPRLAAAGVPAIVAMQGKISMDTVERMMPVFFRELLADGQIDRAMAVARSSVREHADFFMPILFSRLKGARIWYVPGFAGVDDQFRKWRSLTDSIRAGSFVPVLGPDLDPTLRGARENLARAMADEHGFPLAEHERSNLAKVAQYLSVRESRSFARGESLLHLRREIVRRRPELEEVTDMKDLYKAVMRARYQNPDDPFRILSRLGGSMFLSATGDPLLPLALGEAGAKPKVLFGEWRKTRETHPQEPAYQGTPDAENPIVYYPFGFVAKPDTVVLTEDDYLDFLIAAADYKLIPRVVRGTVVKSSLLFLGFNLDDWSFRVLFRLIMALDGSAQLDDFTHVGVQIDPSENPWANPDEARDYLRQYFSTGRSAPSIDVYWGSATDFLSELRNQLADLADTTQVTAPENDEDEDDWFRV